MKGVQCTQYTLYTVHARRSTLNHAGALHQPKLQGTNITCVRITEMGKKMLFIMIVYFADEPKVEKKRQIINEVM